MIYRCYIWRLECVAWCLGMCWECGGLFVWSIVGVYEELSTANKREIMTRCCDLRLFSVIWAGLDVCRLNSVPDWLFHSTEVVSLACALDATIRDLWLRLFLA